MQRSQRCPGMAFKAVSWHCSFLVILAAVSIFIHKIPGDNRKQKDSRKHKIHIIDETICGLMTIRG